jgi:2-polyprenyl-3-methyl-5-hydroxy-6-metoxy-1,4-benzoquinol methylase
MNNSKATLESMSQAIWYNQWTLAQFKKFLKGDILEVGCGIGSLTKTLLNFGKIWSIDINETYINRAKKWVGARAKIGYGDIEKGAYFFGKKHFDSIVCINVLEHIKDDNKSLSNMHNLLKPGGYLILLVPAHPNLYGSIDKAIGHYRRYQKEKIVRLFEKNNFETIFLKKVNFLGALGWWFSGKILGNKKVDEEKLKIFNFFAPFALPIEEIIEPPIGTSLLVVARK